VNSVTHPEAHFKKCRPCSSKLGINSDYCYYPACQLLDWTTLHSQFHSTMLFKSGEVIAEEGYPRPIEFNGRAIAAGYEHDRTHANYMNERLQMLEEAIQHVM
jgi:hypothetical protein